MFKLAPVLILCTLTQASIHYAFAGSFAGSTISLLKFDEVDSSLSVQENLTIGTSTGSKWITLDKQRENLYIASSGYFFSYTILPNLTLEYSSNISLASNCMNGNYIIASSKYPFTVFGAPYSTGCSSLAISVNSSGAFQSAFANVTYDSSAGIHGLALSPNDDFIYSADDMGDAVWVHAYNRTTGTVSETQKLDAPTGANPRHLVSHPNGKWVYVLYEELNEVAVYSRDNVTGMLSSTNSTYSLLPSGYTNSSSYWADEVSFSIPSSCSKTSPKYLIASTRSRVQSETGYISAFALDVKSGAISTQLFVIPSTGSGGSANAVAPSPFNENIFAITDSAAKFVEIWEIDGNKTSAAAVAHVDVVDAPANVIWYS